MTNTYSQAGAAYAADDTKKRLQGLGYEVIDMMFVRDRGTVFCCRDGYFSVMYFNGGHMQGAFRGPDKDKLRARYDARVKLLISSGD